MSEYNELTVMDHPPAEIMDTSSPDAIFEMARRADETVKALNQIMQAAVKITTEYDWVLIGGKPYLQESGASKVRALFGVSWTIDPSPSIDPLPDGHKSFTYHGTFTFKGSSINAQGSRASNDDFFIGKSKKPVDQIDMGDVRKAAYTNCINNGIKRIIPGLRNIDVKVLENAGMDVSKMQGYVFREGAQGGKSSSAAESGLVCSSCNAPITQKVASFSQSVYSTHLCIPCQGKAKAAGT